MAWFLAFDGVNDRVPLTDYTIQTNDSIKARVVHKTSSGDRFIFSGFISGNAGRWQVETFSNKWFVRLGATSSGTSIAPMLTDGQAYDIELKRTGTLWEFIVDGSTIWSLTTSFTPLPLDAIGASGGGSFFAKIELEYLTTNTRNYSAAASTKGAGSTILNDIGVDNLDATGIGFPTDGSQWINTGGAISIIVDSGDYSLSGTDLNLLAQLNITTTAGSYLLTGTQTNLITARRLLTGSGSYSLTGTDVTLIYTPSGGGDVLIIDSGVYSLAGDEVILRADLSIIVNSGDYSLTGTNTSILFNGNIVTESNTYLLTGTNVNIFANYGIIAQTTSYSLTGSSVTLKYSGDTSQTIGVVTSSFADSLYSSGFAKDKYGSSFKPNTITVNFKG